MSDSGSPVDRAVAPVLALTLLVGVVAVGSVGIFLVGTESIENTKASAETERVEQGFVQLGKDVHTVALSSQDSRTTTFDIEDDDAAVRKEDVGRITVTVSGREDPIVDRSIGALEFRDGGTVLAYQAGGVWRGTGRETRMVSAPEIHYRHGSLTLPILSITGEDRISGDRVTSTWNNTVSPLNDVSTVEGKLVTVTIQSEYYAGWADFFESRTSAHAVSVDHANESVTAALGQPKIDGNFDDAVVARGNLNITNNGCIYGNITVTGSFSNNGNQCTEDDLNVTEGSTLDLQPLDIAVDMAVDAARDDGEEIEGNEIDAGTYYVGGNLSRTEDLTVDVSDGDVSIVVDGHVKLENAAIEVTGTDGSDGVVQLYTTGDVAIANGGGGVTVENDESARFQLYGTPEMHFAIGQGEYTGTIYAPRDEPAEGENEAAVGDLESAAECEEIAGEPPDVCFGQGGGGGDFVGSIVSGPVVVEQSWDVHYDEELEVVEPEFSLDGVVLPPPLTYLHVVVYEIDVAEG